MIEAPAPSKAKAKAKKDVIADLPTEIKILKKGKLDLFSLAYQYINCCIGAGLLTVPKIFSVSGFVMSAIYQVASVAFCVWCFKILVDANYHGNFRTLRELTEKTYGRVLAILTDISILICNIGFLISYITVSSDYIRRAISELGHIEALESSSWQMGFKAIVTAVILLPLTLLRSVASMNYVSTFAVLFVFVAVIAITVRFAQFMAGTPIPGHPYHDRPPVPVLPAPGSGPKVVAYFTVFFSLYSMHASTSPVQIELKGTPKQRRATMNSAIWLTLALVTVIYVLVAVEGALMFDASCPRPGYVPSDGVPDPCLDIKENILLMFKGDTAITIIRLLYALVILVSYPVMLFPMRSSIAEWFHVDKYTKRGYLWYLLIGFVVTAISMLLAIAIPQIDVVLSIASNLAGILLYECLAVVAWYKLPLIAKYSVGDAMEAKLASPVATGLDGQIAGEQAGAASELNDMSVAVVAGGRYRPGAAPETTGETTETPQPAASGDAISIQSASPQAGHIITAGPPVLGEKGTLFWTVRASELRCQTLRNRPVPGKRWRFWVYVSVCSFLCCFNAAALVCELYTSFG